MQKLRLERAKRRKIREDKKILQMEKVKKEAIATENRKEWVQKKLFEQEKDRREKEAQLEFENLKVFNVLLIIRRG